MICYSYIDRFERKSNTSKDSPKEIYSECGNPIGIEYEYRTKDGIKNLVPCGKIDRQALIDSYADDCDIVKQVQKFLDGDTSVMNPNSGFYGDFTNVPTTYAEIFDRVQQCKNVFDKMPIEVKEKFDNSYETFWSQFGSERFDKVFNELYPESNTVTENDHIEKSIESEVK